MSHIKQIEAEDDLVPATALPNSDVERNQDGEKEDDRYTPSIVRREAHKLDTKKLHAAWNKAYLELRRKHPGMSDNWYALEISKLPVAKNRRSETIRKNMKK